MTAIKAIAPTLVGIALLAPIITGYRRERLSTSIWIGWCLIVFAYFAADFLIPELVGLLYGQKAGANIAPENGGTLPALAFGWMFPLILHPIGFVFSELYEALCGLLSKFRGC